MTDAKNNYAHDESEACMISQGLVMAELLVPVCVGYRSLTDVIVDQEDVENTLNTFSTEKAYVYRYPGQSNRAGAFELFGPPIRVTIPRWIQVDGDGNVIATGGKDSTSNTAGVNRKGSLTSSTPPVLSSTSSSSSSSSSGYVQYTIDITLGDEHWEVMRRYNEFLQYNKAIQKEKVKPNVSVSLFVY